MFIEMLLGNMFRPFWQSSGILYAMKYVTLRYWTAYSTDPLQLLLGVKVGKCNCDPVRPHVTGSNDAILNEGGRTTAVFGGGAFRAGFVLGHSFGTPPRGPAGQHQSRGLDWYDQLGLAAKFP
jgi:hypothetical protein